MSMEPIDLVNTGEDVYKIIDLERAQKCNRCKPENRENSQTLIREFADWWLSEEQQQAWGLSTFIELRTSDENNHSNFKFKIQNPRDQNAATSIFFIICQHFKSGMHYELHVPDCDLAVQESDLRTKERIDTIKQTCAIKTRSFRWKDRKSICLDQRILNEEKIEKIKNAISQMVVDMSDVLK